MFFCINGLQASGSSLRWEANTYLLHHSSAKACQFVVFKELCNVKKKYIWWYWPAGFAGLQMLTGGSGRRSSLVNVRLTLCNTAGPPDENVEFFVSIPAFRLQPLCNKCDTHSRLFWLVIIANNYDHHFIPAKGQRQTKQCPFYSIQALWVYIYIQVHLSQTRTQHKIISLARGAGLI